MTKTRILSLLSVTACMFLSGCNSLLSGGATSTSQIASLTAARVLRMYQGFSQSVVASLETPPASTAILYDGNLYYYKVAVAGTVTTITYYYDSGATISEGTITATNVTTGGATTQTYQLVLAITGLTRPVYTASGSPLILTIPAGNSPVTLTGTFTENSQSGAFPLTVNITNTAGALSGTISGTAFGTPITIAGLSGTTSGVATATSPYSYTLSGTATLGGTSPTFTESLAANGSGSLSLSDGTTLTWNGSGGGTLTVPGANGTINIANVDSGQ